MQRAVNYLRGNIRAEAICRYPERFVNICAKNGIEFWDMERTGKNSVRLTVNISGYKQLGLLKKDGEFEIKPVSKKGVPFLVWNVRKRYALIFGMVLCLFAAWFMSLFIWEIEVSGNETVPSSQILSELKELGVDIGTFGFSVTPEYISNEMIQRIPEISWMTVNVNGGHADVLVRERIMKPDMVDEKTPTLVYASKSGIISDMRVLSGDFVAHKGDTVLKGDTLVTGVMNSVSSGKRMVHAMAEVYARTWYKMSAQMPLQMNEKDYTGEEKTKIALVFGEKRINLYFNGGIPWQRYDKITDKSTLTLPDGTVLPISMVKEHYAEYEAVAAEMSKKRAEELLKEKLLSELKSEIGDGEIKNTCFEVSETDGVLTVALSAECNERIDAIRPLTDEEMVLEKTGEET